MQTLRPLFLNRQTGRPTEAAGDDIIVIGGIQASSFTVNNVPVVLADGNDSVGEVATIINLQTAYNNTDSDGIARINLANAKHFELFNPNNDHYLTFDADTGSLAISGDLSVEGTTTVISSEVTDSEYLQLTPGIGNGSRVIFLIEPEAGVTLQKNIVDVKRTNGGTSVLKVDYLGKTHIDALSVVNNIEVGGTVDGVDIATFKSSFDAHVAVSSNKHLASEINVSALPSIDETTYTNVQLVLEHIDTLIDTNATNITDAQNSIGVLQTSVSNNTTAIAGLSTNVTTLQSDVTTIQSDISVLQTSVGTNTTAIAGIQTDITDINDAITVIDTSVTNNTTNITQNTGDIVLVNQRVDDLEASLAGLNSLTHDELSASSQWTINHGANNDKLIVQFYDTNGELVYPERVESQLNSLIVDWATPQAGNARIYFTEGNSFVPADTPVVADSNGLLYNNLARIVQITGSMNASVSGTIFEMVATSDATLTLLDSDPIGTQYCVIMNSANNLLFATETDTILSKDSLFTVSGSAGAASIVKINATTWWITGDLV